MQPPIRAIAINTNLLPIRAIAVNVSKRKLADKALTY